MVVAGYQVQKNNDNYMVQCSGVHCYAVLA